jgi:hypothetical protein
VKEPICCSNSTFGLIGCFLSPPATEVPEEGLAIGTCHLADLASRSPAFGRCVESRTHEDFDLECSFTAAL